jgi:DNA-binding helix-hairpin-helix protein with protein kinase domain
MARRIKSYVAGAIPTTTEVSDLRTKVVQLEQTDAAFKREMTDEVARDKRVEELTKDVMAKQDVTIGGLVKDIEKLKDGASVADINIGNLGKSVNSAGQRANQAFDKASQNENSIAGINQEQQNQNVRLDDIEADLDTAQGDFDQLKIVGVLATESTVTVINPKNKAYFNFAGRTVSVDFTSENIGTVTRQIRVEDASDAENGFGYNYPDPNSLVIFNKGNVNLNVTFKLV